MNLRCFLRLKLNIRDRHGKFLTNVILMSTATKNLVLGRKYL